MGLGMSWVLGSGASIDGVWAFRAELQRANRMLGFGFAARSCVACGAIVVRA